MVNVLIVVGWMWSMCFLFDRYHPIAMSTSGQEFQISYPVNGSLAIGGRSNAIVIGRWMPPLWQSCHLSA